MKDWTRTTSSGSTQAKFPTHLVRICMFLVSLAELFSPILMFIRSCVMPMLTNTKTITGRIKGLYWGAELIKDYKCILFKDVNRQGGADLDKSCYLTAEQNCAILSDFFHICFQEMIQSVPPYIYIHFWSSPEQSKQF